MWPSFSVPWRNELRDADPLARRRLWVAGYLSVLFPMSGQMGVRAHCVPGEGARTLATIMYDLNVHRVVLQDRRPMILAPADKLANVPTCRDCGAVPTRQEGPVTKLCDLCYVNRLVHGRKGIRSF